MQTANPDKSHTSNFESQYNASSKQSSIYYSQTIVQANTNFIDLLATSRHPNEHDSTAFGRIPVSFFSYPSASQIHCASETPNAQICCKEKNEAKERAYMQYIHAIYSSDAQCTCDSEMRDTTHRTENLPEFYRTLYSHVYSGIQL